MKKTIKIATVSIILIMMFSFICTAFAAEVNDNGNITAQETYAQEESSQEDKTVNVKAVAAAAMIAIVATGGAIAMAVAISKGSDGIARQPEAAGNIRTNVMLGLVFIETAIIYALIVAILIIFVL